MSNRAAFPFLLFNLLINLKIWQTWSGTNRYLLKIFRANFQTTERFELIGE